MANKGGSRHIMGLAAPQYFGIHRKEQRYVIKPNPGRHSLNKSVAALLVLKKLAVAGNKVEALKILNSGSFLVGNKVVKEAKYPIGMNDIIELKGAGRAYIVGIGADGRISFSETKPDYNSRLYKIVGKYKAAGGTVMLRLHDGTIVKAGKETKANVEDSVMVDAKEAVKKVLPMAAGSRCIVIDGVHIGKSGKITEIKMGSMNISKSAVIEHGKDEKFETTVKNIMVTG